MTTTITNDLEVDDCHRAQSSSKLIRRAGSRLRKWEEYESMLRQDKKCAFRELKRATSAYRQAIVESNEPNIAVPILLSMVVELKSQLDRVEDEVEVLRIKNKLDRQLGRANFNEDQQETATGRPMTRRNANLS